MLLKMMKTFLQQPSAFYCEDYIPQSPLLITKVELVE